MHDVDALVRDPASVAELRRSLRLERPPPLLRDLKIKLTSFCNLRCVMCGYWKTERETALPTGTWLRVLSEAAALGARKVHFSGGEVFLRKDFLDIVEHACGLGLKVNMTTNGTLLGREAARRIRRAGVNSVSISLDGPTAAAHNAVRGRAYAFRRSLRAVRRLARAGPDGRPRTKVRINFVVMRDNFRRLPRMTELAGRLGAVDLVPMPVDEKGPGKKRLSKCQIREYNRELAPRALEIRRRFGLPTPFERIYPFGVTKEELRLSKKGLYARGAFAQAPCLAPWLHTFIAWDGEVYLCCMTNGRIDSLGNAGDTPLRDIFHGEAYRRVRAAFAAGRQFPICARCDLFLPENRKLHAALE